MIQKIVFPIVVLLLACLGAFGLVASAPSVENVTPERSIPAVRIRNPQPQDLRLIVRSQGTVAPRTESALVPEVSGRVVWVSQSLVSGGFFDEGEPLLRIDRRSYEMAVARARAALSRAESEFDFATSELKRQQGLSARKVASTAQLSQARRTKQVTEATVAETRVALEQAEWDLDRTEIVAPFAGRVRKENVDVGQVVSHGAAMGMIYATDHAEIRLPVPDHQLAFLRLPRLRDTEPEDRPKVLLRATFAGRKHEWQGTVVRTEGEIDPRSRMVHVVARVDDPYGVLADDADRSPLAVGLFVHAEIEGTIAESVIVVPRYAMRNDHQILVVDREDRLRTREVEVLRFDGSDVLIQGSLAPGERICVSPMQVVVEGMRVQPLADDEVATEGSRT
jgi:RND family efflux transporter MFP subunit